MSAIHSLAPPASPLSEPWLRPTRAGQTTCALASIRVAWVVPHSSAPTRAPRLQLPRAWSIALAAVAAALTIAYARRPGDFAGYVMVGELVLHGRDIYRDAPPGINTWPPFFALLCAPIALMARVSLTGARVAWLAGGWVALWAAMRGILALLPKLQPAGPLLILLPPLLCVRWILANFEHLQINILMLALVVVGLGQHRRDAHARAGLLLGAAAAIKVMPILFAPYFAWRRQWRAAAWLAAATAAWSLVPVAVYGPAAFVDQLRGWSEALRAGWGVGRMNVSVYAALDRIIGHGLVPFATAGISELPSSNDPRVTAALAASVLAILAAGLLVFRGPYDPAARATVAEWSVVLLVANLFGTVAWKAYFVVLLLPMALFVATFADPGVVQGLRRRLRWLTGVSFVLGLAATDLLVGPSLAWRLEMGSLPTLMALLILGTLFWYRVVFAPGEEIAVSLP